MSKLTGRGKKSRLLIAVLAVVFAMGIMQAYAYKGSGTDTQAAEGQIARGEDKESLLAEPAGQNISESRTAASEEPVEIKSSAEEPADIKGVDVDTDIQASIKKLDSKNYARNVDNYKKVLAKYDLPKEYKKVLEGLIKKGHKMPDILGFYDFLHTNYGQISELDAMLDKLKAGTKFEDIAAEYISTHPEYVPTKFDSEYIEELMKTTSIDDIMIADRISLMGLGKFEDLLELKKSGKTWKEINTGLGIVNTSELLPRMQLTSSEVEKCMKDNRLGEEDAKEVLVMAWKTGKDYSEVKDGLKKGEKKEKIFARAYNEKYK